jgi:hypothetical protein
MRLLKFAIIVAAGATLLVAQLTGRLTIDVLLACIAFTVYTALGGLIIFRHDGHITGWLLSLLGLTIVFADPPTATSSLQDRIWWSQRSLTRCVGGSRTGSTGGSTDPAMTRNGSVTTSPSWSGMRWTWIESSKIG